VGICAVSLITLTRSERVDRTFPVQFVVACSARFPHAALPPLRQGGALAERVPRLRPAWS
jgi:hypothetical protein